MDGKFTNFKALTEKKRLTIPAFQRPYVWKSSNFEDFVEDIMFYNQNKDYGFIGTIILKKNKNRKKVNYEIVDGQQRITSLMIFLIALTRRLKFLLDENNQKEFESNAIYFDAVNLYRNKSDGSPILQPHEKGIDGFKTISNPDWNPLQDEEANESLKKSKDPILVAYREFQTLSENFGKNRKTKIKDITELIDVISNLNLNLLTVESDEEAFYTFETTNSRGVSLGVQDQLRNHIFSGVEAKFREEVRLRWDEALDIKNPSQMLRQYYFTKNGYISQKQLYKAVKKLKIQGMELLTEIEEYSRFFKVLENGSKETFFSYFKELIPERIDSQDLHEIYISSAALRDFKTIQPLPAIYSFLKKFKELETDSLKPNKKNIKVFFKNFENFLFINYKIGENRANAIENITANLAKDLNNSNSFEEFKKKITSFYRWLEERLDPIEIFKSRFVELKYVNQTKNKRDLRYLFSKHETHLMQVGISEIYNPEESYPADLENIEHWYPQNPKKKDNLSEILDEKLHNIGNLLTINAKLNNNKLRNMTPHEKYKYLRDEDKSNKLNVVKTFLKNYSENEFNDWGDESISKRAKDLADFSYEEVWTLDKIYYDPQQPKSGKQ